MSGDDPERILASAPSPFSDSVLPNAFRDTPDVPEIHADARARLLSVIEHCRRDQVTSLQVITGDPGEGKTHLLAWLRRTSEESWLRPESSAIALAPIEPVRAVDRIFHHVLHETVRHLRRPLAMREPSGSATESPLELMLWRAILQLARRLADARWVDSALSAHLHSLLRHHPERFLATFAELLGTSWHTLGQDFVVAAARLPDLASIDAELLRVVLQFPNPALRADVLEWLGGASIPDDRLERLGTRIVLDGEQEAWRGLNAVLHLARMADVSLVLAFDQIEGTERLGEEAVAALLAALAELFNAQGAALISVFCQTQIWPRMRERAQLQARDRLDDQPALVLKSLTAEQAAALVEARMRRFWSGFGVRPPTPIWPFSHDELVAEARSSNLRTPRSVLLHFRSILAGRRPASAPPASSASPIEILRTRLRSTLEDEARKPPRLPDARADIVQSMLREAFKAAWVAGKRAGGARVESVEPVRLRQRMAPGTRSTLERAGLRRRIYFEATNSAHGGSVAAATRRLKSVLRAGLADRVVLIRESSVPLPPLARDLVADLAPHGVVLWLDDAEVVSLSALESLLNAAAAGDIPVSEADARQTSLELLAPLGALLDRTASLSFDDTAEARHAATADPTTLARVRRYFKEQRAIETLPALAERLGLPVDVTHAAVDALRIQGALDVIRDQAHVHVALWRPED